ncbi:RICIN domain-containing protein [Streptomyces argenteolus]|uniref:RICIN domain-containing protein n=1 Tax=Streptomyces argenteolus TaxID=67274 RepID=A0ABW6XGE2_9ACTN
MLGDDPKSSAAHETPRAGSSHAAGAPYDGGARNGEESTEEDGKAGKASGDGAKKGQEEKEGTKEGTSDGGALRTPEDTGTPVASTPASDAKKPGAKAAPVTGQALIGQQSGKCLSAGDGGAQLTIRTCDGSAGQRWEFRSDGTARSQGQCMDLAGTSKDNGTAIRVSPCTGAASQQFRLNATDDLVAGFAAKCVDVYDGQSADGTRAVLWPCTGAANQTWTRR